MDSIKLIGIRITTRIKKVVNSHFLFVDHQHRLEIQLPDHLVKIYSKKD